MTGEKQAFEQNWQKYGLALLAFPGYMSGKPNDQDKASARLHLKKTRDLEGLTEEIAETGVFDVRKAFGADAGQYEQYFGELTVDEALQHVALNLGYTSGFEPAMTRHSKKKVKDLVESAKKYKEAAEAYEKAGQTKDASASARAIEEMKKYEDEAQVYGSVKMYDGLKLSSVYGKEIAGEMIRADQKKYKEKA